MRLATTVLALALLTSACDAARPRRGPDVLFLTTPDAATVAMLELAAVGAKDVVYDLGSGDGRVVITAARRFGARGVGVEIDPKLVQDSRDAAAIAGVAERVSFVWADLFDTDLRRATVVTLYLLPELNLRLRPRLLEELAPGARVVSYRFDMGDWRPDRVVPANADRPYPIYLWTIPPRPGRP